MCKAKVLPILCPTKGTYNVICFSFSLSSFELENKAKLKLIELQIQ